MNEFSPDKPHRFSEKEQLAIERDAAQAEVDELRRDLEQIRSRQVQLPVVGEVDQEALLVGGVIAAGAFLLLSEMGGSGESMMALESAGGDEIDPSNFDSWQGFSSEGMQRGMSLSELGELWE